MDQKSVFREEGLGEVIELVKDLIAKNDSKMMRMQNSNSKRLLRTPANKPLQSSNVSA